MTERVQKAIDWVMANDAPIGGGIFNSRNIVGDRMETVYREDGITIDACYDYAYIEVFGMDEEEFSEFCEAVEEEDDAYKPLFSEYDDEDSFDF